jgi:hypothetical protein
MLFKKCYPPREKHGRCAIRPAAYRRIIYEESMAGTKKLEGDLSQMVKGVLQNK